MAAQFAYFMLIYYSDPNEIYFLAFVDHGNRMIETVLGF